MSEEKKYLAEAVKDGTFDFQKRSINKKDKTVIKRIASALPKTRIDYVLVKKKGFVLKENGMSTHDGKEIEDNELYTVYQKKEIKTNQYKKLIDCWKVYSSPVGIVFYGISLFPDKRTHNQWVEIVNQYFNTNYPPLYPDDYCYEEDKSDDKQEG